MGDFQATDFGQLFDQTYALPWERWIPPDGAFPVDGRSLKSQLSSVPACQRMVKKAIAERLLKAHKVPRLDETGATYQVEVSLVKDEATLTIDTSGSGLHKRGYRPLVGQAPLRETLAAGLILLSFWRPGRPFLDPFCGTGTIPIEAAMIGRNMAPGLGRRFAAEDWPTLSCRSVERHPSSKPAIWHVPSWKSESSAPTSMRRHSTWPATMPDRPEWPTTSTSSSETSTTF